MVLARTDDLLATKLQSMIKNFEKCKAIILLLLDLIIFYQFPSNVNVRSISNQTII